MPDTLMTTHKFSEQTVMTFTAVPDVLRVYVGTGLFDPSVVTGAQPLGFPEMIAIYGRYQVLGCQIIIDVINPSSTLPLSITVLPNSEAGLSGMDSQDYRTNPYARGGMLTPAGGSKDRIRIKHYASSKAIFGQSTLTFQSMWGTPTANPIINWFWIINASFPQSTTETVFYEITLKFFVRWGRKELIDPTPVVLNTL